MALVHVGGVSGVCWGKEALLGAALALPTPAGQPGHWRGAHGFGHECPHGAGYLSPGWFAGASWRTGDGAAALPEDPTSDGLCCYAVSPFCSGRKDSLVGWDKKGN